MRRTFTAECTDFRGNPPYRMFGIVGVEFCRVNSSSPRYKRASGVLPETPSFHGAADLPPNYDMRSLLRRDALDAVEAQASHVDTVEQPLSPA